MYSYVPKNVLPPLKKAVLEWDLKNLFYTSDKDSRIEKDLQTAERAYADFAKKYAKKNFTAKKTTLLGALKDYEALLVMPERSRPSYYYSYRLSLNAMDAVAEKQSNLISNRMTKAGNQILFFGLALGKIPLSTQKELLKDPAFSKYQYYLTTTFLHAKHMLSEAEEKIVNLHGDTSYGMWVSGTEKIIANRKIIFEKKELSLNEAIESLDTFPKARRTQLWRTITSELTKISEVAENEFNAIITNKKVMDDLRGFTKAYEATVLEYENQIGSVEALVESISTKGFALSKKFYTQKAKLHGVDALPYEHKYEPIGESPRLNFDTAVTICRDAFYGLNPVYGNIFDTLLSKGHVDVYPKAGKRGGAFMSSGIKQPTLVFLNHTDTLKALETLAHEMGHATHTERSKSQPALYEGYSMVTAETASTFFENLVYNALLAEASPAEKIALLHERITRDIATIERQIAFFNYEKELHERIRTYGAVTKEELAKMMQKHLVSYLGKSVTVTEADGYSFVYVHHFRYGFYVYSYAYGLLMSNLMHLRLKADPNYKKQIDAFLTSGGRAPVETIFKDIGLDPLKVETFNEALDLHRADIDEFIRLTTPLKKKASVKK